MTIVVATKVGPLGYGRQTVEGNDRRIAEMEGGKQARGSRAAYAWPARQTRSADFRDHLPYRVGNNRCISNGCSDLRRSHRPKILREQNNCRGQYDLMPGTTTPGPFMISGTDQASDRRLDQHASHVPEGHG